MFSKISTETSTQDFSNKSNAKITQLRSALDTAEAVVIGAGAGLSAAAGFTYSGERFNKYFQDFKEKYGITDMYSGGFYPYETFEEYWAWWSRAIYCNRYADEENGTYRMLLNLVKDKDYFVITTNVDHCFQKAGFSKERLFYTQGDYGLFQCSVPCHQKTYDNEETIVKMVQNQKDMKIPSELIPYCPKCGKPMTANLRCDDTFVQDEGWYTAQRQYADFIERHKGKRVLFLELGVGDNTPAIIKYPFWQLTKENKQAVYACINLGEAYAPAAVRQQAVCINDDITGVLRKL